MRLKWMAAVLAVAVGGPFCLAQDKPKEKPAEKKEEKKDDAKAKGQLPQNWKSLGLTDEQTQKVYKLQAKTAEEIDKLEAQIKELKDKLTKERLAVLTDEQKKRLEGILKEKAGTDKKEK